MLNEKRIREAENNVKMYLENGLLKKIAVVDNRIVDILVKNSGESLRVAEVLFRNNLSNLWTMVCSYYAMYYISRALLYKLAYKVGEKISHKVTADALIVYVRNKLKDFLLEDYENAREDAMEIAGLKADELIKSFDFERIKRSKFQYSMTHTVMRSKAQTSLERAKNLFSKWKNY